ncbi:hypothetical protein [Mongoliibacter ruber]|uniref:Uncharacterized protein n=1 Tax=Mongoliibacter ruber TaxID=1750599 RepID=A0A2T0WV39_9BACT|nr:hypothetical protein [Mongoliibacter ruber]PRY90550.1 hypothetical protein CLW00_101212 [Mongoliibacter ruber]
MKKPKFLFALYKFSWVWVTIFGLSIIGSAFIAYFSEVPEVCPFGYETGLFLMPLFNSLLITIPVFFFTSHLQDSKVKIEALEFMEAFRKSVLEILEFAHKCSEDNSRELNLNEENLMDKITISVSPSLLNKSYQKGKNGELLENEEWLLILIKSSAFLISSDKSYTVYKGFFQTISFFEMIESDLTKPFKIISNDSIEAAQNSLEQEKLIAINIFLKNLLHVLDKINEDRMGKNEDYIKFLEILSKLKKD